MKNTGASGIVHRSTILVFQYCKCTILVHPVLYTYDTGFPGLHHYNVSTHISLIIFAYILYLCSHTHTIKDMLKYLDNMKQPAAILVIICRFEWQFELFSDQIRHFESQFGNMDDLLLAFAYNVKTTHFQPSSNKVLQPKKRWDVLCRIIREC
jgi:hypothetical protein